MTLRYVAPLLALALTGCFDTLTTTDVPPERGTLAVELSVSSSLLETNRLDHTVTIVVQAHHPNDKVDDSYTTNLQTYTVNRTFSVPPVKALVTATANRAGEEVAKATASVMVTSGATAPLSIQLKSVN